MGRDIASLWYPDCICTETEKKSMATEYSWMNPKRMMGKSDRRGMRVSASRRIKENEGLTIFGGTIQRTGGLSHFPKRLQYYCRNARNK